MGLSVIVCIISGEVISANILIGGLVPELSVDGFAVDGRSEGLVVGAELIGLGVIVLDAAEADGIVVVDKTCSIGLAVGGLLLGEGLLSSENNPSLPHAIVLEPGALSSVGGPLGVGAAIAA